MGLTLRLASDLPVVHVRLLIHTQRNRKAAEVEHLFEQFRVEQVSLPIIVPLNDTNAGYAGP